MTPTITPTAIKDATMPLLSRPSFMLLIIKQVRQLIEVLELEIAQADGIAWLGSFFP